MTRFTDIDLIIFDCDGVLVDSEALAAAVWSEFLAEYGVSRTPADLGHRYAGLTDGALRDRIVEETGVPLPANAAQQIEARANGRFDAELRAIDGIHDTLDRLPHRRCVCTNSGRNRLHRSLETVGLIDRFKPETLYYAALVPNPKPAPDLHHFALLQSKTPPERAIVIEDSVTGVTAAKAAGIRTIGFTGAAHTGSDQADRLKAAGADHVVREMGALAEMLAA